MAKKSPASRVGGGALVFIGSLIYLYVVFSWYTAGAAAGTWLSMAQFLAPFVVAVAIISAITLFFMSIGTMAMESSKPEEMNKLLWKFIVASAVTLFIITGVGGWFYFVLIGFILTYIGAMLAHKM